jgi:2-oxo-4-hydroxy-4-carboxy-5-ureidoimidazoline decarboxylase
MIKGFPFDSEEELFQKAAEIWFYQCSEKDWLEAFTHHPRIGDIKSLEKKFATTKTWAGAEQAGVQKGTTEVIAELAKGNEEYEKKFGFIFIVCATGKSAEELLNLLKDRLGNRYEEEVKIAMGEQAKITGLRLQKLLTE